MLRAVTIIDLLPITVLDVGRGLQRASVPVTVARLVCWRAPPRFQRPGTNKNAADVIARERFTWGLRISEIWGTSPRSQFARGVVLRGRSILLLIPAR